MANLTGVKNKKPKKARAFSFAFDDGYEALEWLEENGKKSKGGKSSYLVRVLLEDKLKKTGKLNNPINNNIR